jgi:ABC-type antimicrobial peptide transport system permease subunit
MTVGSKFRATHGFPGPNDKPDIHKPQWTVVGILKPTHTANDRVLFIPYVSLYAIADHELGMLQQALMKMQVDPTKIPPDQVDAVLVKLGFDLNKVPASALKDLKQEAKGTKKVNVSKEGELMKDLAAPPTTQVADEGVDPDVYHLDDKGHIIPDLPEEEWELSAILVKSRSAFGADQLLYRFKVVSNEAIAVNPASVMRDFFDTFLKPSALILLVVTCMVTVVAGISILVSIYNSISARMREIAILRALGATRARVLTIFCTEAAMIGFFGAILGLIVGHGIAAVGSVYFNRTMGQSIAWYTVSGEEWLAAVGAVAIAALAGLVPAMKAYRTPVAVNLVSG